MATAIASGQVMVTIEECRGRRYRVSQGPGMAGCTVTNKGSGGYTTTGACVGASDVPTLTFKIKTSSFQFLKLTIGLLNNFDNILRPNSQYFRKIIGISALKLHVF